MEEGRERLFTLAIAISPKNDGMTTSTPKNDSKTVYITIGLGDPVFSEIRPCRLFAGPSNDALPTLDQRMEEVHRRLEEIREAEDAARERMHWHRPWWMRSKAYSCDQHARVTPEERQRLNQLVDQRDNRRQSVQRTVKRERAAPVRQNNQRRQMCGRSMRSLK